jgi:hypothetical protein
VQVRVIIHVRPGASRAGIGGGHGGALVVKVRERAVDGRANEAVVEALARALGLHRRSVSIVSGHTARRKVVDLSGDATHLAERWEHLLGRKPL